MHCTSQSQVDESRCVHIAKKKDSVSESSAQTALLTHHGQPTQCKLCIQELDSLQFLITIVHINVRDLINCIFCWPSCIWDHLFLCQTYLDQLGHFSAPHCPVVRISLHSSNVCISSAVQLQTWPPADSQPEQRSAHQRNPQHQIGIRHSQCQL